MILHVDMDAFYASVEQRDDPSLAGRPVIVGGRPDQRGVVSAASYEARRFGVHSAMPTAAAVRLCPEAALLPVRMDHYAQISRQIRSIFESYTPLVEPLSLDEAFLDVTGSQALFGNAEEIGRRILDDIRRETQLTASVGVAPNKFLAKLASDLEKPAGFVMVADGTVDDFLGPLGIERLWGVGRVANRQFERLGVRTIGQLRALGAEFLREQFGAAGEHLWKLARGIDERRVVPDRDAKSISHETTFATDVTEPDVLRAVLWGLVDQVGRRLRRHDLAARTVHLKIRYDDFRTYTRAEKLPDPTHSTEELGRCAEQLLRTRLPGRPLRVRLLGMGTSGLMRDDLHQRHLFDEAQRERQSRLDDTTDALRSRFGSRAISRAIEMKGKRTRKPKAS